MSSPILNIATWSPAFLAPKQKIPRRILRVHCDQQELLDREDAWDSDGFANVPAEILQEVKTQYIRSIVSTHSRKTPSPPLLRSTDFIRQDGDQDEPSTPKPTGTGSEEGTPIPWSPSPEHHIRPVHDGEAKDTSPGLGPPPENNLTPLQKAIVQTPDLPSRALPERPSSQKRPEHRPSSPPVFKVKACVPFAPAFLPSSSVASEGGLEFEVPKAVTDVLPPVNKGALPVHPEHTPPSAQIIPASYLGHTTPSRPPPEKRRRLTKSITTIYSDYRSTAEADRSSAAFARAETEGPSITRLFEHIADSPHHPEEQSADGSSHLLKTAEQSAQHLASSDEKIPPNGPPSQVPYTAYKVAYPDYKASLSDFVRAVLCVHDLRKQSAIMEFLYDDFVRYYCDDYLQYIREAEGKVSVRPAIKLYNDQVSRPHYQKGVLTKENINDVLDKYPKMVRAINETLGSTTPVTEENGDSSKPQVPVPLPLTTSHLPKPRLVAKSITQALVGSPATELASDPIHPPSPIPTKRLRPVIQTIDRSVPRRLSNRPLELEPPLVDEPTPSSDAAPIEIVSASSSSSPSLSPPPSSPPVLPQTPTHSQGGPSSPTTQVTRPQEQIAVNQPPREASAASERPRLDTSPAPPPPSSAKITTQQASISPPPPRRFAKVDVGSLGHPITHQPPRQGEDIHPNSEIVPGTPAPSAPAPHFTAAPSPSRPGPLITQIPANTNFLLLSQLSNADSIPDPSDPSVPLSLVPSSASSSKLLSSMATTDTNNNSNNNENVLPPPSRPATTMTTTHLNPLLTQISNADSIPDPSLPPRLQRQRKSSLTSSNLSRLAHITSTSKRFLQKKQAVGAAAPSSSRSGSGSASTSVVMSSNVVSSGDIVKDKGKGKKAKGKGKDTGPGGRDLRSEYFVNFVREKKMREAAEKAAKAAASSSHPVSGGSNGKQAAG
ncbi:hypothetical protein GE21DRAFT_332 [Neurospora crassa]|uniref:Uncharacterized protein n=1 Tax=Neurospora crassa (strain ATCC 24698 / 74-OR23-1A / CBS 708.71 / DSM 1257 / FGSC 987) TaxID=367110 RepID=Q7SDN2_NEUCR|nr:hypothetical protein NCU02101 [Neurospora crassa OR74A]EAA34859.2 hypothetical protein NCU02101 [Neurospora crassa OR74A]KHE80238.1 hypothetical protein GE21DRAFT_332 [Neurospora crassa]|eukprot:XP_964095.2 hypothetical protein NCU02101 [Neurospora crassa OR74A]